MLPTPKVIERWEREARRWERKNANSLENPNPDTIVSVKELVKLNKRVMALAQALLTCNECREISARYAASYVHSQAHGTTPSGSSYPLSMPGYCDPLTVGYLASCLEDLPDDAIIFEIKTRASEMYNGEESDDTDTVAIISSEGSLGFD